jgi:hypothetical protein
MERHTDLHQCGSVQSEQGGTKKLVQTVNIATLDQWIFAQRREHDASLLRGRMTGDLKGQQMPFV